MSPHDIQTLLGNTVWLRALARQLLRDADAADDVVQETMVAALERPPAERGDGLRGWLVRVTRNLAVNRTRTEQRRRQRERALHGVAAAPSVDESVERIATQRAVAGAVLALEPEDRQVVVLRYFEDLPPREIAARLGTTSSAVRSRLSRALGKLRARLDARYGGERQASTRALALLAAPARGSMIGLAVSGALLMKALSLIAAAALLVAISVLASRSFDVDGSDPADLLHQPPELTAAAESPEAREGAAVHRDPVPAVPEVAAPAKEARRADPADQLVVHARVVDPEGRPIEGATMTASQVRGRPSAVSGADGLLRLEVAWPPRLTEGNNHWAVVEITCPGRAHVHKQERIHGPETVPLGDVTLQPGGSVSGFVRDADGRPAAGVWMWPAKGLQAGNPAAEERRRVLGGFDGVGWFPMIRTGADGRYRIDGVPATKVSMTVRSQGCYRSYTPPFEVVAGVEVQAPDLVLEPVRDANTIRGVVLDAAGRPIRGAEVSVFENRGPRNIDPLARTRTGPDGSFSLMVLSKTGFTVQVEDHAARRTLVRHDVAAGTQGLALGFAATTRIEVVATDSSGRKLGEVHVFATTPRGAGLRVTAARRDEFTRVIDAPDQPFVLYVGARGYRSRKLGPFAPGEAPASVRAELERLPVVSGRVSASGRAVERARVHLHALPREGGLVRFGPGLFARREGGEGRSREVATGPGGRFELPVHGRGRFVVHAEAEGHARAESQVLTLDDRSIDGVELTLVRGGTLEGRVLLPDGERVEGTLVAASNGDGHLVTQLVAADGRYRFEHLAPGPWHVARGEGQDRQWIREERTWPAGEPAGETGLPEHVVVRDGLTARFDLDFRDVARATLRGTLLLGSVPATGWSVVVFSAPANAVTTTDAAGRFAATSRPGPCHLSFRSPRADGKLLFVRKVDLKEGPNEFTETVAVGGIALSGLAVRAGGSRHMLLWEGGSCRFEFDPDAAGGFTADGLPAGDVVIRCREPGKGEGRPALWTEVGGLKIVAGERARFSPKR